MAWYPPERADQIAERVGRLARRKRGRLVPERNRRGTSCPRILKELISLQLLEGGKFSVSSIAVTGFVLVIDVT